MAERSHGEPEQVRGGAGRAAQAARIRDVLDANVFVLVILGICVTVQTQLLRGDVAGDSWYTLLGGRIIARFGLPHHDVWTVLTLGRVWVDQQWLAQLGFYGLWRAGGWSLALLAVVVFYLTAFATLALNARRLGASDRATAVSVLVAYLVGLDNSVLRAQIPAYALFAGVLALLVSDARNPSPRVYLVFPLLAVWANIHGSVVLGAGLVALRGATVAGGGLRARAAARTWLPRAAALLAVPWLCALVSPYGLGVVHYYHSVLGNHELQNAVSEWAPTTIRSAPVFFALLLVTVAIVSRSVAATTWFERIALTAMAVLAIDAGRYVVWFALVTAAVLPFALDALWAGSEAGRRVRLNVALAAASLLIGVGSAVAVAAHGRPWFERGYPPAAEAAVAAAARSDPKLLVYANERYADWLLFEDSALEGRVAYDIRFELLTASQFASLVAFRDEAGPGWQEAARGYGVLVLDPSSDGETIGLFEHRRGTRVLFASHEVVVLRRPSGGDPGGRPGPRAGSPAPGGPGGRG